MSEHKYSEFGETRWSRNSSVPNLSNIKTENIIQLYAWTYDKNKQEVAFFYEQIESTLKLPNKRRYNIMNEMLKLFRERKVGWIFRIGREKWDNKWNNHRKIHK